MSAARLFTRGASRMTAQLRAPAQRRFASTSTENEFIKERQHIKDHAKGTTGKLGTPPRPLNASMQWLHTNEWTRSVEEDLSLVR